ncbi:MAG: ABC-type uncharacterized transport system permease subunit [Planctomycetota bacterium]|jgi:ABC-type uncharacterized transport system permease subunit
MNFFKENWRWIVLPILAVLILGVVVIVMSNQDGLGAHRYGGLG